MNRILIRKNIFLLAMFLSPVFAFPQFVVAINPATGAISKIENGSDPNKMNWVISSGDGIPTWQKANQDWGMGKYTVTAMGITNEQWNKPVKIEITKNKTLIVYRTKCLDIKVTRIQERGYYTETYEFSNTAGKQIDVSALGIYTPFNDNYPDAVTCATNRCNTHIWPGAHSSYVNAIRMDGKGPHLGLVLTKGSFMSYSVENRGDDGGGGYSSSNVRGTFVLDVLPFTLKPAGKYTLQWKLFWHKGWSDFFAKAKQLGFVKLDADKYVVSQNEPLQIKIDATTQAKTGRSILSVKQAHTGEYTQKILYDNGKKYTFLNYLVISSAQQLMNKRVHFIAKNQQLNDSADIRNGAYMVYDNELNKILTNPLNTSSDVDRDEGAERLGMGLLMAGWLKMHPDEALKNSLLRYVSFVRHNLQTPDYKVYSNATQTSRHRGYNYPWVAHLYLAMYELTGEKNYLADYYGTLRKFFEAFGHHFYAIDIRIKDGLDALRRAGMPQESDSLLRDFKQLGDYFIQQGIHYPKHEVNYEQSIVAPSVSFLCDLYLATKESKYLAEAEHQLPSLEAFGGKQPDVHLNEIAIRHWDGYWFGKRESWGDVMPHYWSTLTAVAFHKYYQCTGKAGYQQRAERIVENNLLNFKEDGSANCAYIYPAFVNNKPAKFYDPYANDQDWAMVFYLEVKQ